ncbi:MAG: glycosyltransferase [Puniceicoccales bacterium]
MLYFDATNSLNSRTKSGLQRVAQALRRALEAETALQPVTWNTRRAAYLLADGGAAIQWTPEDTLLIPDIFSEEDRPGYADFIAACPAQTTAIFHDAIPLRFPEFTWPHSVRKAPRYLKDLSLFDRVFAVSNQSRRELTGFWDWLNLDNQPPVTVVPSGADIHPDRPRKTSENIPTGKQVLKTGILEPRKNQTASLAAARILHEQGVDFRLGFVGRVNPHYGKPITQAIRKAAKAGVPAKHHGKISDDELAALYREARFTLLPSRAEGNGLPVLESLWQGLPVICSNLPAAQDWAEGASVRVVDPLTPESLAAAMRDWLEDDAAYAEAVRHARGIALPTWRECAQKVLSILAEPPK